MLENEKPAMQSHTQWIDELEDDGWLSDGDLADRDERRDLGIGSDIADAPILLERQFSDAVPRREAVWAATLYEVALYAIEQSRPPRSERDADEVDAYGTKIVEARTAFERIAASMEARTLVPEIPEWWDEEDPFHLHPMSPIRQKHVDTMARRRVAFEVTTYKRTAGHAPTSAELKTIETAARLEVEEEERARQLRGSDRLGGIPTANDIREMFDLEPIHVVRKDTVPKPRPAGKPTMSKRRSARDVARERVLAVVGAHPNGATIGAVRKGAAADGKAELTHTVAKKLLDALVQRGAVRVGGNFRRELYFLA